MLQLRQPGFIGGSRFNTRLDAKPFDAMRKRPSLSSGESWVQGSHDARWDFRGSGPHCNFAVASPEKASWSILMTRHVVPYRLALDIPFQKYVRDPSELIDLDLGVVRLMDRPVLGSSHPTIIFRHPSRNDDSRTLIAAALPESGFIHNKGYVHAIRHREAIEEDVLLALLGYLNSHVCDWWARRFVDRHVTAPVVNNLPLPDWNQEVLCKVAQASAALLARGGVTRLAGCRSIVDTMSTESDFDLHVMIDVKAAQGFDLGRGEVIAMMQDFSTTEAGCSTSMRAAIAECLR